MKEIKILTADAVQLALDNFGDATGFVQILEANNFLDWTIHGPIIANTTTSNLANDVTLMIPPTDGLETGMLVYCPGYDTYGLVTAVENIYTVPSGIPFAQGYADLGQLFPIPIAGVLPSAPIPIRIMPPLGNLTATKVSLEPPLDNLMIQGSQVIFATATPGTVVIPTLPPGNRGTP